MPHHDRHSTITTNTSDSPFSDGILEYEFPKKFTIPIFDCYFGQSDPVQHLCQYEDKMVIHVRNDSILCQIFTSSLKGRLRLVLVPSTTLNHNFEDLTKLFLTQYSSCQEFKQNNYHILFVKMRPSDGLKVYIGYFHNQLAKVHNYNEDAFALVFISRLWVTHLLTNIW